MLETLQNRVNLLQQETQKATTNVTQLSAALEQAKNHALTVQGHLNESSYLLATCQKLANEEADKKADDNAVMDSDAKPGEPEVFSQDC